MSNGKNCCREIQQTNIENKSNFKQKSKFYTFLQSSQCSVSPSEQKRFLFGNLFEVFKVIFIFKCS